MALRARLQVAGAVVLAALTSACAHNSPTHPLTGLDESIRPAPHPYSHRTAAKQKNGQVGATSAEQDRFRGIDENGTGTFVDGRAFQDVVRPERTARGGSGITLNLVNVPVAQAAKSILGDILKANYTVAEQVTGTITIQTSSPMSTEALLEVFESALRINGVALVRAEGHYKIVPTQGALQTGARISRGGRNDGSPGVQIQVVPLNFVAAAEMRRILEPIAPAGAIVSTDDARGMIVVAGSPRELADIGQLIQLFDVDWMRGMSVGVVPARASDPEALAREVETVMGLDRDGPLKGLVRIVPNRRLSAVMVIAQRPQHLETARKWLHNLDKAAARTEEQLFVYKLKNRVASEVAVVVTRMISQRDGGSAAAAGAPIAPRFDPVITSTIAPADAIATAAATARAAQATPLSTPPGPGNLLLAPPPATPPGGLAPAQAAAAPPPGTPSTSGSESSGLFQGRSARIVADEANNSLLITATQQDYDRIAKILARLDVQPTQVMLEALIAEVTLNDDLKFGVKWSHLTNRNSVTFSDRNDGSIASNFPGFSYFFQSRNFAAAIDALQEITKVKVMSAPSLMVLDNRRATLQVGDQVPILTQTASNPLIGNGTAVNSIAQRDTGIILSVQPRVSDSGRVTLDIEQEVSNVTETSTSTINSPTFQQRRLKTTVVVSDGEVIALGGLIQERDTTSKSQVPLLGQIPLLGSAFRQKGDKIERTELMVFLRPTVVRDAAEARDVTEEFRQRLSIGTPTTLKGRDKFDRDAQRMFR